MRWAFSRYTCTNVLTVIETHPENATDLRLSSPFQQLSDYVSTFDLDKLDQTDHSQIPFVVIILIYVEAWKAEHEGQAPQTYQQRQEFIKKLRAGMRTPDEENFEEAITNAWRLSPSSPVSKCIILAFILINHATIFDRYHLKSVKYLRIRPVKVHMAT